MKSTLLGALAAAAARFGEMACAAVNLAPLSVEKTQTAVSGLTFGGFLAAQLRVVCCVLFKKAPALGQATLSISP